MRGAVPWRYALIVGSDNGFDTAGVFATPTASHAGTSFAILFHDVLGSDCHYALGLLPLSWHAARLVPEMTVSKARIQTVSLGQSTERPVRWRRRRVRGCRAGTMLAARHVARRRAEPG